MRLTVLSLAACLAGCSMQPMTPQQQAYLQQMQLEQQRAYNQQQLEAQRAIYTRTPPAQQPMAQPIMQGVSAFWTGRSQTAQSVTGAFGTNCEFNYAGKTFWRMFQGGCPSSIQVQ